jgi:hypothetical protein
VLTLHRQYEARPATRSRRPFPLLLVSATLAVTAGCTADHVPDVEGTRRVTQCAIRELRTRSPRQAHYLERLVSDAETATAGELTAPPWRRTPGRAQAAWLRVVLAAREAVASQRSMVGQERAGYFGLLAHATPDIARARAEIRETGMGRREGAAMERANVSFAMAERLAAASHYQRASDKLRQASADIAIVHRAWLSLHARFSDARLRGEWAELAGAVVQESRDQASFAIVVDKLRRQLILYYRGLRMAAFEAELGANGLRQKEHAGDRATPEGLYRVVRMKEGRATKYYKALLVDYPNERDRARFEVMKRRGQIPPRAGIGGQIEIHGEGGQGNDWTDGCIALTNKNMDILFGRVKVGTPVAIVGTFGG